MMNRIEFLSLLEKRLQGIPKKELNETLEYWNEIISDKIEDGMSEEEVINGLDIHKIVELTLSEISFPKLVKEKMGLNRKIKTWEIVLLVSTFFIWIPLLIALIAVVLALYVCIWSGVISLAAVTLGCGAHIILSVPGFIDIFTANYASGIFTIGISIAGVGAALILGFLTVKLSKLMLVVTKKIVLKIKTLFIKRGEN